MTLDIQHGAKSLPTLTNQNQNMILCLCVALQSHQGLSAAT